jgi:WD40 repeat protein
MPLSFINCLTWLLMYVVVRTLTGHRSNCMSVDFHPFGEFFASGSLDTNLKIWDIRRKGCIHTYKGHTRGVNAIRFTPDGRWVVSGGEDSAVKVNIFLATLYVFQLLIRVTWFHGL